MTTTSQRRFMTKRNKREICLRGIEFKIGEVTMLGISPRARCVVPARDSQNSNVTPAFASTFVRHRAANLPEWSTLNEYRHHYYLTVNCFIPATEIGKIIGVGDKHWAIKKALPFL